MIHYGAHIFVWHERYDNRDLIAFLEHAAELSLAWVEIAVGDGMSLDAEALGRVAWRLNLGIVLSPGGVWPHECDLSLPDAALRRQAVTWHKHWIDICAECGAMAYTGALYGHPGRIVQGPSDADELARSAEGLQHLAEHGGRRGVVLVLEPMSHFRTHMINTPRQALDLLDLCDHDNLSILLDTYHLCTEITSFPEAIRTVADRLWGIHACENNRGCPGTGILPWREITDTLREVAWSGYIGFESYNSSCRAGQFARSRGMFHDVCPDGDAFVTQARQFLESCFRG